MSLYPLFANLKGRPVLVVGGGAVAARKVAGLREAGALVRVGAPQLDEGLARLAHEGAITHFSGRFEPDWLDGVWLAIAATDEEDVNAAVAREAEARRIFVNVVDDAERSVFHVPARLRRGALTVAISSGGRAPVLARRLRAELETHLDTALGELAELAGRHRAAIAAALPDPDARRRFHDDLVDGPVGLAIRQAQPQRAEALLLEGLKNPGAAQAGSVAVVGAGPGDADLLTVRAQRALQRADVIVHDRLIGPKVLDRARRDALLIDVGKAVGQDHEATQNRIHDLLVEHARAGRRVVRLKGGDPFVFGRGGEELEHLAAHGIAYEVIPGVTAALACAAYAGVPLTHRDHAASLVLTTTHRNRGLSARDWRALALERQTLALYMGVSQLESVPRELMRHGRAPETPFALVENGTDPSQRVLTGRLDQLSALARAHGIRAPALLFVGEVAGLARKLAWFGECISAHEPLAQVA